MRRLILIGALLLVLSACGQAASTSAGPSKADTIKKHTTTYNVYPDTVINTESAYTAVIKTNLGDLSFDLLAGESPLAVNSFVFLAREGFFDGVPFHRIIPGFMAQG